ncbi:MAG: hypothetical protein R1F52_07700 [Candidatus Nitrosoabyssus spongiisocia]|nr:MAG: hypothetical protein R1F52_07700 [Nitrosopumilaceae archaeon AB1(1)]
MKVNILLGIICFIYSGATVVGMIIDNADYWLIYDIIAIIFFPIIGFQLIRMIKP